MKKFSKTYAEKLVPLDEEEIKNRLQRVRDYRDRAEERRQGYEEETNEQIVEEGEAVPIKLNGLDFDFMSKAQGDQNTKRQLEIQKLRQFKESGALLSMGVVKKPSITQKPSQNPLCSRILNALKQDYIPLIIRNSVTFYEYDMDPLFPQQLPQIVTKKSDVIEKELEMQLPRISQKLLDDLSETLDLTLGLTIKRTHQQRPQLFNQDAEPDNIFDNVESDGTSEEIQQQSPQAQQFDPKEYLQDMQVEEDMLNVENNLMIQNNQEEAEKARQQKLKKHLTMMQEDEDYYQEAYLPTNLTIEEDRRLKLEMEEYEQNLPPEQRKKIEKQKKKQKKRENYTQQLEQIDRIIKKTKNK